MVSQRSITLWRKKRLRRTPTYTLCLEHATTPAIGGIEVLDVHLTCYPYLPAYVVLHEPSQSDIWASKTMRLIFLNQPLQPWEHEAVSKFRDMLKADMKLSHDQELPRWLVPHLSRVLQQCKYKPESAMKIWPQLFEERVSKLPIKYEDVRAGLAYGFVYFHGRDTRCRPLLTIRMGRAGPFMGEPDLIKKVFLYAMEFAVRYLLVPGRVECWSVIIDCEGIEQIPSMWKAKDFAQAIATSLGKVYSGRMAWTKIFHFPKGFAFKALKYFVEGIISALGKSDKVSIVSSKNASEDLRGQVELGQLEKAFGGTAPDLDPSETFPFRMFDSPAGYSGKPVDHVAGSPGGMKAVPSGQTQASNVSSLASVVPTSVHMMTDVQFHEGLLCADCLNDGTGWKHRISKLPLPTQAAEELRVQPCTNMNDWCEKMAQVAGLKNDDGSESSFKTGASGGSKGKYETGGPLRGAAYSITEEDEYVGLSTSVAEMNGAKDVSTAAATASTAATATAASAATGEQAAATDGAPEGAKAQPSKQQSLVVESITESTTSASQVILRAVDPAPDVGGVDNGKSSKKLFELPEANEKQGSRETEITPRTLEHTVAPQTSACMWRCWAPIPSSG